MRRFCVPQDVKIFQNPWNDDFEYPRLSPSLHRPLLNPIIRRWIQPRIFELLFSRASIFHRIFGEIVSGIDDFYKLSRQMAFIPQTITLFADRGFVQRKRSIERRRCSRRRHRRHVLFGTDRQRHGKATGSRKNLSLWILRQGKSTLLQEIRWELQMCYEEHKKKYPNENVQVTEISKKCSEKWKVRVNLSKPWFFPKERNEIKIEKLGLWRLYCVLIILNFNSTDLKKIVVLHFVHQFRMFQTMNDDEKRRFYELAQKDAERYQAEVRYFIVELQQI